MDGIFDNYNFDWSYGNGNPVGNALNDYMSGNISNDYGIIGNYIDSYKPEERRNINISGIGSVLGRFGSGLGTGIASYKTLGQPDYIFLPRYAGNGLASTTVINNAANKQRQLDQIFGAGDYLSSLFGQGLSISRDKRDNRFDTLPVSYDMNFDVDGLGAIGDAADKYIRG